MSAILWGSTAAVVKLLGINLNSLQILFYSSAIATLSLFVIALSQHKLHLVRTYTKTTYIRFAYMAFLGVFLYYVLLYTALQLVPGQEAFVVNYTWPIWVVVFASIILKEKFTNKKALAILFGFIGVAVVITKGNILGLEVTAMRGNALALIAAVSYGLFSVLSKKNDDEKVLATMFYYAFSFIYVSLFIVLFSSLPMPTTKEWIGLIWLGVFTSGVAYVFWQLALKYGDTSKMSNVIFITPFISLVYLVVLTGEEILLSSIIGASLMVTGVLIQNYTPKKNK